MNDFKEWLSVILEEYKSLRCECHESMKNQLSTLQVGTGSIGILIGAGFGLFNVGHFFSPVIFLLFVPALCYLVLFVWIGEVMRMMRAGKYVSNLEIKLSSSFPNREAPLNWENYLRSIDNDSKTPQLKWNYKAIIGLFFCTAFSSTGIGLYNLWPYKSDVKNSLIFWACSITSLLVFLILAIIIYKLAKVVEKS